MAAATASAASAGNRLYSLFWRIHFWGGLLTAPLVVFAALTGLVYVCAPQVEALVHASVDRVPPGAARTSLDRQVQAARDAVPGAAARAIVPAHAAGWTTQVHFTAPAHGQASAGHDHGLAQGRTAYVDPHTAQVVGVLAEKDRFKTWAKKLHSSALQGDGWRWAIELAASWMLAMCVTGWYLWWSRVRAENGAGWRALWPRRTGGRAAWRSWHATLGLLASGVLLVVLVTGLTWSRHAGQNFRAAQQALGQAGPKPPSGLRSSLRDGAEPLSLQAIYEVARSQAPDVQMQLHFPQGVQGTWRVENFDRAQPRKRFALVLDAGSGQVLYRAGWDDLPLLPQATAVGIPFHRGEFGLWNQLLLAFAAVVSLFLVVSGWVMWWMRRPAWRVGVPRVSPKQLQRVPVYLWLLLAAMAFALPVFGISVAVLAAAELSGAAWRHRSVSTTRSIS